MRHQRLNAAIWRRNGGFLPFLEAPHKTTPALLSLVWCIGPPCWGTVLFTALLNLGRQL